MRIRVRGSHIGWYGIAIVCLLALVGSACGGDGGGDAPTPVPTPESIDPQVLAQAIFREDDLPDGYETVIGVSVAGDVGLVAESISRSETIYTQASVVWMPTDADAERSLARYRGVMIESGWTEENDEVEGANAAFKYTKPSVSGFTGVTISEPFVTYVQRVTNDQSIPNADAENEEEFDRLNTIVARRVAALKAGDITPVSDTPVPVGTLVPAETAP